MFSHKLTYIFLYLLFSFLPNANAVIINSKQDHIKNPIVITDSQCQSRRGILILAHGKSGHNHGDHNFMSKYIDHFFFPMESSLHSTWEQTILDMVNQVRNNLSFPIEVAFGMWDYENFQKAVNQFGHQNICSLEIIPLFVSEYSDVIRAQKYQFRINDTNPLPFPIQRINFPESVLMVHFQAALNDDSILSQIIQKRALEISQSPQQEELILVAHGPNGDEDDLLWLRDLNIHGSRLTIPFYKIHTVTLRDDAPEPIQNAKTLELRSIVQNALIQNHTPLILPVLIAPGGIEEGLMKRLNGLSYKQSYHMLAPDPLLIDWIINRASTEIN